MKKVNFLLFLLVAILLFSGCEKDENGNRIQYYSNKTGEGYVFLKFENDSIAPINNITWSIKSDGGGALIFGVTHYDYVNTDINGYYSFKFVKKIDGTKVDCYELTSDIESLPTELKYYGSLSNFRAPHGNDPHIYFEDIKDTKKYSFDTLFLLVRHKVNQ
ncbi:MAG: hypothetical protein LBU51_09755 [Bacteroidales bacterium]|jgi:hypothetical protein|nr:hypothetical protein [Bacteroidales bacterium]